MGTDFDEPDEFAGLLMESMRDLKPRWSPEEIEMVNRWVTTGTICRDHLHLLFPTPTPEQEEFMRGVEEAIRLTRDEGWIAR